MTRHDGAPPDMTGAHQPEDATVVYLPATRTDNPTTASPDTSAPSAPDAGTEVELAPAREAFNTRRLVPEQTRERMAHGAVVVAHRAGPVVGNAARGAGGVVRDVARGVGVVWARYRDNHSAARYERMMQAAEVEGDHERLLEWEARAVAEKQRRHARAMEWLASPLKLVGALAVGIASIVALLLALGIILAIGDGDIGQVVAPIAGVLEAIRWAWWFATAYGIFVVLGATTLGLVYLYRQGHQPQATTDATWAGPGRRAEDRVRESEPVTPSKVVDALKHLGNARLRKAIEAMADGGAGMLSPIVLAGTGVEVDVELPRGTNTEEVKAKRRQLAENLDRHEHEVFIDTSSAARTVRLWIADAGALDEPIDASPLVVDGEAHASVHSGRAPWGRNLRNDPVELFLWQMHLLITGKSNMGKTAALRALVLWAAFDPTTRFRIADLKGLGDWHMFKNIADVLIEGPTDAHVIAATEMLEDAVEEMDRRLQGFDKAKYPNGVPAGLPGYEPLFVIVDEAQVAFMCPALDEHKRPYGGQKTTSRYFAAARKIHNQGRAVNVVLWQGTQDPTDQNLPKMVREGAHIRASLHVGTESQARMGLGENAVNEGAAPHELKQEHKGTLVVTGPGVTCPPGKTSEIVRTHYIGGSEATALAERAEQRRAERPATEPDEQRDLLADVHTVLGSDDHIRTTDVVSRLRKHAAHYPPYQRLNGTTLAEQLDEHGVSVTRRDGIPTVYTERVRAALAHREHTTD
ncbi:S-DNA-T family DNA segregation ATPase FtsK/SpoIIIE [Tamaricihabitans halophyticus]|uniref:S-DNA-T family DNA segregation ATPase FtsK/SpoIIIE n=1 Tax=Tamaricihabitans halophyticus TaxID=1262583 RepID=A0A4R2PSI8_9PSEU|nr:FtsK/SpoIIIE domain-containing protein [Tamaricihabitans halophyticus]TCP38757.1 S-DNA-T family DNA segregation ATPase FtsK/SpoIIIE [Tamaricihabitans halophyticus]